MLRQTPAGITLPLPSPLLGMLPPKLQKYPMKAFWLNFPLAALLAAPASGAQVNVSAGVNPNFWFAGWYGVISLRSSDNQTDRSTSPLTATMTDNDNFQYQPQNTTTDIRNFLSTAGTSQPAVWASPLIIPPSGQITLTLQSLDTVNAVNARVTFVGVLIQAPANLP